MKDSATSSSTASATCKANASAITVTDTRKAPAVGAASSTPPQANSAKEVCTKAQKHNFYFLLVRSRRYRIRNKYEAPLTARDLRS